MSLIRLSEDSNYIDKIYELINTRKNKGKKDKYYKMTEEILKDYNIFSMIDYEF